VNRAWRLRASLRAGQSMLPEVHDCIVVPTALIIKMRAHVARVSCRMRSGELLIEIIHAIDARSG